MKQMNSEFIMDFKFLLQFMITEMRYHNHNLTKDIRKNNIALISVALIIGNTLYRLDFMNIGIRSVHLVNCWPIRYG